MSDAGKGIAASPLSGRDRELEAASRVLEPASRPRLLLVHGSAGIGKTTLVRELAARAANLGFEPHQVDARELSVDPDALAEALEPAVGSKRPLVVVDSFELIEAAGDYLRAELLPSLPAGAAVAIVGRSAPDSAWFRTPAAASVRELHLEPLDPAAARDLLAAQELDEGSAEWLFHWARGNPLALSLGFRVAAVDPGALTAGGPPERLVRALVRQLDESALGSAHAATLAVAAIARTTTPALLAAALPEHDADGEWAWLAGRGFVEPVGEGIALHALLRDSVRADLKRRDAQLERDLKRRIGDYLYQLARSRAELSKVVDLSYLIEDPALRWGFTWEASERYYVDSPRDGDVDEIERLLEEPGVDPIWSGQAVWEVNRRFLERMPELGAVVRDGEGRIAGFTFVPTTAVEEPDLETAPVIGPLLRHARELHPPGEALLMTDMSDLTGDPANGMVGILANAALLRASRSNPRYVLMTIDEGVELGQLFAENVGADRVPELDAAPGEERLLCWLLDFGPGGFLANQLELLYRELNLEPPQRPQDGGAPVSAQVRDALRELANPVQLAESPLARGQGVEERAGYVRDLLEKAAEKAFGDEPDERLLRDVIVRGYLDPAPTHELAADRLHLSRSAYFRRLKQAVERVAEYVAR